MIHFNILNKTIAVGLFALFCNNMSMNASTFYGKVIIGADHTKYAYITKCIEPEANLNIPKTLNIDGQDYPVKAIGSEVFKDNHNLISVTFPLSLERIDRQAFQYCTMLEKTNLSELRNISYIGEEAFQSCLSLSELIIKSNNSIDLNMKAFSDCNSLQHVIVECGQTTSAFDPDMNIGLYTFSYCPSLDFAIFHVTKNRANERSVIKCDDGVVRCDKLKSLVFNADQIQFDLNIATSNEALTEITIPGKLLPSHDSSIVHVFEKCPAISKFIVTGSRPDDLNQIKLVDDEVSQIKLYYPISWNNIQEELSFPWNNFEDKESYASADDNTDGLKANKNNDQSVMKATPARSYVNFQFGNQNFTKKKS